MGGRYGSREPASSSSRPKPTHQLAEALAREPEVPGGERRAAAGAGQRLADVARLELAAGGVEAGPTQVAR